MYRKERNGIKMIMIIALGMVALLAVMVLQSNRSAASRENLSAVQIFSADTAPTDGVVAVYVQYGVNNVPEGWLVDKWAVGAGQHIDREIKIPAGKYARVWFRSANSMTWTLLPSQYWHEGGACGDEFGVSARSDHPSYHTYFAKGITQQSVPLLTRLGDCPYGSFTYNQQSAAPAQPTTVPQATLVPTPVPSPTPCVALRTEGLGGCEE